MHYLLNAQSLPLVRDRGDLEVVLVPDASEWSAGREALPGQFSAHVVSVIPHGELEGQVHARIIPQEERTGPATVGPGWTRVRRAQLGALNAREAPADPASSARALPGRPGPFIDQGPPSPLDVLQQRPTWPTGGQPTCCPGTLRRGTGPRSLSRDVVTRQDARTFRSPKVNRGAHAAPP